MGLLLKNAKHKQPVWVTWGICISLLATLIYIGSCDYFKKSVEDSVYQSLESGNNLTWLYQSSSLLYKDLYNKINHTKLEPIELYLKLDKKDEWFLTEKAFLLSSDEMTQAFEEHGITDADDSAMELKNINNAFENYFGELENSFETLNITNNYLIEDLNTGTFISNYVSEEEYSDTAYQDIMMDDKQCFAVSFIFDDSGFARIGSNIVGRNPDAIRKVATEVSRNFVFESVLEHQVAFDNGEHGISYEILNPRNCRITFSVSSETLFNGYGYKYYVTLGKYYSEFENNAYLYDMMENFLGIIGIVVVILALFSACESKKNVPDEKNQAKRPWEHPALPLEALAFLYIMMIALSSSITTMVVMVSNGEMANEMTAFIASQKLSNLLAYIVSIIMLFIYFFALWYLGMHTKAVTALGVRDYIKQRCLVWRFFPFMKRTLKREYEKIIHLDLSKNAHRTILKIILLNAVILFFISFLWFGGMAIILVYSVLLYFILRKYVSNLQKKYGILLKAMNELAEGRLDVVITEDMGIFELLRPHIYKIQEGVKKAVAEQTKSQRMKVELITNVSHDLRTPLTAIITYISLLKDENITEEKRREYLSILERKSLRLKVLIEDLFEVSKANSQNVSLNLTHIDIMNLIKQVAFEMEDKLSEANLELRLNLAEEKIILSLDSQKTYRIYENLFANIAKYALPGTRVYVDGIRIDDKVIITLKNITADEIQVNPEELTDRFVRGERSRHSKGSGLGLAIVKSFTELQGGELKLELDGDLFKVTTQWSI